MEETLLMSFTGLGNTLMDGLTEKCTMQNRTIVPDGLGGYKDAYVDGVTFDAVIRKDDTTQDRIAEKQGIKESYTVVVQKGFPLTFHDVFRREKDGNTYRVTSNIQDKETPAVSNINIGAVRAERWDLPA
jgi:hypothetical protein